MAYTPTPEQQAKEYTPKPWHPRYEPRPDPLVCMERADKIQPIRRPWFEDAPKTDREASVQAPAQKQPIILQRKPRGLSAGSIASRVLEFLRAEKREWISTDIAKRIQARQSSVQTALDYLEEKGRIASRPFPGRQRRKLYRYPTVTPTQDHDEPITRGGKALVILRSDPRPWLSRELAEALGCEVRGLAHAMEPYIASGAVIVEPYPPRPRLLTYRIAEGAK